MFFPYFLDGNIFLLEQGMPMLEIDLNRILLDDALPDPFAVATHILMSFTGMMSPYIEEG